LLFQLAVILLVLIISYGLQVKFSPFMSPSAYEDEVARHHQLAKDGHPFHQTAKQTITPILIKHRKHATKSHRVWTAGKDRLQSATTFIFDYNTLESVLLYCAILLCIAGVMFESGQLDERNFKSQRTFMTVAVMLIICFSLLYFIIVLVQEIFSTCCPDTLAKATRGSKKAASSAKEQKRDKADRRKSYLNAGKEVHLATNPMLMRSSIVAGEGSFASLMSGAASITETTPRNVLVQLCEAQREQLSELRDHAVSMKRTDALRAAAVSRRPVTRNKKKTRFGATHARSSPTATAPPAVIEEEPALPGEM